jgi:hypothetical protein
MLPSHPEFVGALSLSAIGVDARSNQRIREMLRRSGAQLARSYELLRVEVPNVWHPEPPKG